MAIAAMHSIRAIRYFAAVAETGGFSSAALSLSVAQPSVTSQIQALERELGIDLLIRHSRGATLTEAGQFFYDQSIGLLRQIDALTNETRARANHPTGTLIIGTTPSLRSLAVAPALRKFCEEFPDVRIRVVEDSGVTLCDMVRNNQADLVIVPTIEKLNGFGTIPLISDPFCLIGSLAAGLDMAKPKLVQELQDLPLAIARHPNSFRLMLDRLAARVGIEIDVRIESDTLPLSIDLVGVRGCYTLATGCVALEALRQGRVSVAPLKGVVIDWVAVTASERARSAATLAFSAILQPVCASLARPDIP